MPRYLASKPLTLLGKQYKPGQELPMDSLDTRTRENLIKTRRAVPDSIKVKEK